MGETPDGVRTVRVQARPWYGYGVVGMTDLLLVQAQHGVRYDNFRSIYFRSPVETEERKQVVLDFHENFLGHRRRRRAMGTVQQDHYQQRPQQIVKKHYLNICNRGRFFRRHFAWGAFKLYLQCAVLCSGIRTNDFALLGIKLPYAY